ncbi:hypothetical protein BN1723_000434 [Verticillium longisporum]|uniref:Uncharacterized protein n=1 Tax=Verticillium longisporum TaxID=100787 RepID=A0A0G4KKL2_VERLO|nr:hypothetical protein BN1708_009785 [Verticillium longisporum]CRK29441.1 hypothetical protein BN1723_000434 [Verticillium longisporum]
MPDPLALDHQTVRAVNGPSACFLPTSWHSLCGLNGSLALPNRRNEGQNQVDASALGRGTAALNLAVFSGAPSNMVTSVRFVKWARVMVRWATLSRRRPKIRDHSRAGRIGANWRAQERRMIQASAVKPPADLVNHPLLRSCTDSGPTQQSLQASKPTPAYKPVVEAQPVAVFRLAAPVMQLAY